MRRASTILTGILTAYALLCVHPRIARADLAADLFGKAQRALVIITTSRGTASGFVLEMDGKKYLVTNEHVLRGGKPTAKLLTGHQLRWKQVEIADDKDLARLELHESDADSLPFSAHQPNMGDRVFVFGNSEGGGVATSLAGKILGVGPDQIEIDAAFVQGNSGSPILGTDGTVYGVATYVTQSPDPNDWVKKGTRFTEVRRFGLRMAGTRWVALSWKDYAMRAETLVDLETYCVDAFDLCYTDKYADPRYKNVQYTYDYGQHRSKYIRHPGLCKILTEVAETFTKYAWKDAEAWYHAKQSVRSRSTQDRNEANRALFMSNTLANQRLREFQMVYNRLYDKPAPMILRSDWKTTRLKREAMFWHDVLKYIAHKDEE